jgi:hypothetical protein
MGAFASVYRQQERLPALGWYRLRLQAASASMSAGRWAVKGQSRIPWKLGEGNPPSLHFQTFPGRS